MCFNMRGCRRCSKWLMLRLWVLPNFPSKGARDLKVKLIVLNETAFACSSIFVVEGAICQNQPEA
ncbi:hypothetical protein DCAR_0624956 [Daucus carota subsp. sativus]|uniref:Uncharacterized protein n=1 Tax=Daucus carota subsp. sativus TaxID=79200 RepID=A0A164W531_DAUCS|nr:hypothetical protein DCAR_0624956 [Daucus carota subsp. sativus]